MTIARSLKKFLPAAVIALFATSGAYAAPYLTNPDTCTTDSVSITSIEVSPLNGEDVIYSSPPNPVIYATSCFGKVTGSQMPGGNDHANGLSEPDPNIGQLGDGLLNGEGGYISPTQFITPEQLLDLNGDGNAIDPGWIFLGSVQGDGNTTFDSYDKPLNIGDILSFTLTCNGTGSDQCVSGLWTLETSLNIIDVVQEVLGRNAFDHLAFVIKAGPAFAIYDFDFNILGNVLLAAGGDFDFETPYSFTGEWNTNDFMNPTNTNPQAFSHISLWARDPVAQNQVPVPGTLALLGLGLLALRFARRRA